MYRTTTRSPALVLGLFDFPSNKLSVTVIFDAALQQFLQASHLPF